MRAAIVTMALGAFAIGLTEFAVMGLLPQVATGLAVSVPTAGAAVGVGIALVARRRASATDAQTQRAAVAATD